jgi:hypothetical protein
MMRRVAWAAFGLLVGLGLAVWAAGRLRDARQAFTPAGIAEQLDRAAAGARGWREEIRQAAAQREAQLRASLFGAPTGPADPSGQPVPSAGRRLDF